MILARELQPYNGQNLRYGSLNQCLVTLGARGQDVYAMGQKSGTIYDRYERYELEHMIRTLYRSAVQRYNPGGLKGHDKRRAENALCRLNLAKQRALQIIKHHYSAHKWRK